MYDIQLLKILAFIQQWNRRILTLIGRVTVIKTLILPKLKYLFISLTNSNNCCHPCPKNSLDFYGKPSVINQTGCCYPKLF